MQPSTCVLSLLLALVCGSHCFSMAPKVIPGDPACPSQDTVDTLTEGIRVNISNIIQNTVSFLPQCGDGKWYRVVNFPVTPGVCPSPWALSILSGEGNGCGRATTNTGSCDSVFFSAGGLSYSTVCGKIIARATVTPDAFENRDVSATLEDNYVDGISVTHSMPRTHIWTFATDVDIPSFCPCTGALESFVGTDYFCDFSPQFEEREIWDGLQCTEDPSQTCCLFNSPPYFSTTLPSPTSSDIEVRICGDESTSNENIHIQIMELYIQ